MDEIDTQNTGNVLVTHSTEKIHGSL